MKEKVYWVGWLWVVILAQALAPASAKAGVDPITTITAIDLKKQTIALQNSKQAQPTVYLLSPETTVEIHGKSVSTSALSIGMLVRSVRVGSGTDSPQVLEDIDIP